MKPGLEQYKDEMQQELHSILDYWINYAIDITNGGFVGKIDHYNKIYGDSPKGAVLNSRILWTFSAAYHITRQKEYLIVAERAFHYISNHFLDKEFGGVYWTVDHRGQPLDNKKQVYAISFSVFGMSEYYKASGNDKARQMAIDLYLDMHDHSYDLNHGGYVEALNREWKPLEDLRLSEKDANEPKSMNTHLHVLEAYANLYRIWPDELLKSRLTELVNIFLKHIISKDHSHLVLFFDKEWNERSNIYSYGHDIEAAWLLQEAAEFTGDRSLLTEVKRASVKLADAAIEGLDVDGGLWYEYDVSRNHLIREKHSWPQAEAMIGFFNAWQVTGDEKYLELSVSSWSFIKDHMRDKSGEWYWGVFDDHSPMIKEDKAGIWKCPYHNSRSCIEIINRIQQVQNNKIYEQ